VTCQDLLLERGLAVVLGWGDGGGSEDLEAQRCRALACLAAENAPAQDRLSDAGACEVGI
jgi:hypothetical protein